MKADIELMNKIREAIESIDYGSVKITLAEKGSYIEITTEKKARVYKQEDIHFG
jgi:hypothetical protein